jgi:hypothetical protein
MRSPISDAIKNEIRAGRWGSFLNAGSPADRAEAQRIALHEAGDGHLTNTTGDRIGLPNCTRMNVTSPPGVANPPMYPFRYNRSRHLQRDVSIQQFGNIRRR